MILQSKRWKNGRILKHHPKHLEIALELEQDKDQRQVVHISLNSSMLAPYRAQTMSSIDSVLTQEERQQVLKVFKSLPNLGNTYTPHSCLVAT